MKLNINISYQSKYDVLSAQFFFLQSLQLCYIHLFRKQSLSMFRIVNPLIELKSLYTIKPKKVTSVVKICIIHYFFSFFFLGGGGAYRMSKVNFL